MKGSCGNGVARNITLPCST